jgi:plasmid maintenance system antidote protein VapI
MDLPGFRLHPLKGRRDCSGQLARNFSLSELVNGKRGISPEMAVRISKVFGGAEEGWLVQQAQYDLAQVRRDHIKLKRLEFA